MKAVAMLTACAAAVLARPSAVERLDEQVLVVRDDTGRWSGDGSRAMTHQVGHDYQARKRLDLSRVPEAAWRATTQVRLSVFFCVRDYSWRAKGKRNGLDEEFEIVVNGTPHRYRTGSGVPVFAEGKPLTSFFRWHDFAISKDELVRGPNEFILRKVAPEGKGPDDYLYLAIDTAVGGGNSWVRFAEGQDWRQDKLTVPGGTGEYMVRLYLIAGGTRFEAAWRPGGKREDPLGILAYAGSHGPTTRVEWDPRRLDPLAPVAVTVELVDARQGEIRWLDGSGEPLEPAVKGRGPLLEAALEPPLPFRPSGVELDKALPVKSVTLRASWNYHPLPRRIDMAPHVAPPRGAPAQGNPRLAVTEGRVLFRSKTLRCALDTSGARLHLLSLYNELVAAEMVRRPEDCALFLVEVAGRRYAGSRDFRVVATRTVPGAGEGLPVFAVALVNEAIGLKADLSFRHGDPMRWDLKLTNVSEKPLDFKVAFPHLAGLAISDEPADDYYFFPWGGGIIADAPAVIRRGYGDHAALYQVIDLFSPRCGAGLAIRSLDTDGRYKVLALRKHIPGQAEMDGDKADTPTADEFQWTNPLPAAPGIGVAFEYLRRTRQPGESFAPPAAALQAHPGDWHVAMKAYAEWCHRVWTFRPTPNRLTPIINMIAVGWGQSPLYANAKQKRLAPDLGYRADFIKPRWDCIELMSWWEWSTLGPGGFPFDQLREKLGDAKYARWKSYLVTDPVSGKLMFSNNPGDYDGYNARWGGLPALRRAIQAYQKAGQLVTLYTDPFRVDRASRLGRQRGEKWGVVQPDGSYRSDYEAWRMCHDVAEYRAWVAEAMARVLRETGADGIRLDEYGHKGSACFSPHHQHTFAEPGCTEWQRGVAEATKLVRQAMDAVDPRSVLTTEHPGYDFLMPFIEGCITYDLTVQATPLRPLECNLQRFFFPECKPFELDHRRADPKHRKRFWNGVASFGSVYPEPMYAILKKHADAFNSRDCTPLVPTLGRFVYANRFRTEGKTLYTLYNATGHSFAGPVLRVPVRDGQRVVDLMTGKPVAGKREDGHVVFEVFLPRDDVACIGVLD